MFTPAQYREKAAAYSELAKQANAPNEVREFRKHEQSFTMLADNEQWLADNHDNLAIRAFPEKTESGGIPIRTRIGFKIRAGKEASMGWGSRIRRICVRAW